MTSQAGFKAYLENPTAVIATNNFGRDNRSESKEYFKKINDNDASGFTISIKLLKKFLFS